MSKLSDALIKLRKANGYSQLYVARALDISQSCISGYENDVKAPDTDNLIKLADLYGCSVDFLLGRDVKNNIFAVDLSRLTQEQIRVLKALLQTWGYFNK